MERKILVACHSYCKKQVELTDDEYMSQLCAANHGWHCPYCKGNASWIGIDYLCPNCDEWYSDETEGAICPHCGVCIYCNGTNKADTEDGQCPMCPSKEWLAQQTNND